MTYLRSRIQEERENAETSFADIVLEQLFGAFDTELKVPWDSRSRKTNSFQSLSNTLSTRCSRILHTPIPKRIIRISQTGIRSVSQTPGLHGFAATAEKNRSDSHNSTDRVSESVVGVEYKLWRSGFKYTNAQPRWELLRENVENTLHNAKQEGRRFIRFVSATGVIPRRLHDRRRWLNRWNSHEHRLIRLNVKRCRVLWKTSSFENCPEIFINRLMAERLGPLVRCF